MTHSHMGRSAIRFLTSQSTAKAHPKFDTLTRLLPAVYTKLQLRGSGSVVVVYVWFVAMINII